MNVVYLALIAIVAMVGIGSSAIEPVHDTPITLTSAPYSVGDPYVVQPVIIQEEPSMGVTLTSVQLGANAPVTQLVASRQDGSNTYYTEVA